MEIEDIDTQFSSMFEVEMLTRKKTREGSVRDRLT